MRWIGFAVVVGLGTYAWQTHDAGLFHVCILMGAAMVWWS